MNEELDELARTAADTLVAGLVTDSWEAVKRHFTMLVGHEGRIDATRAELIAADGADRDAVRQAQVRDWSTRLRDVLEDNPNAVGELRELLAMMGAVSVATVPPASQSARADRGSQAVTIGGSISGTTGEVYVGVGKVDKRRIRFFFVPVDWVVRAARKAVTAHPMTATVSAVAVIGVATAGLAVASSGGGSPMASLVGTWQGTYTCAQGLTGVQLVVGTEKSGAAPVQLSFYPVPSNPSVPEGSGTYRGTLSGATVSLTPVAWKVRPAGYSFDDMVGALPAAGSDTFSGTVVGCETFAVHRTVSESAPSQAAGTWEGTYSCAQGLTGVHLAVRSSSGDGLLATFSFYAVPSNPSVPSGSFALTGFIDPAGVFLHQDHWIVQPPGWEMVDVATSLPQDGDSTLNGSVVGCSALSLKKIS
jgi:hypothetical protein